MERYTTKLYLDPPAIILPEHRRYFEKADAINFSTEMTWAQFVFTNGEFRPTSGNILIYCSSADECNNELIAIKSYTWEELVKVFPIESCIILFFNDDISGMDLFDTEKKSAIKDYSKTITYLEERKILETQKSTNWMTEDGRAFRIISKYFDNEHTALTDNSEWWEVDILGTNTGVAITNEILKIYEKVYTSF